METVISGDERISDRVGHSAKQTPPVGIKETLIDPVTNEALVPPAHHQKKARRPAGQIAESDNVFGPVVIADS